MQKYYLHESLLSSPHRSLEEEQVCNTLFAGYLNEDVDKKVRDVGVRLGSETD